MMEARVCDYSVKNGGTFASRYKTNYNLKKEDGKNIDNRCLRIPTSSKSDWTMNVVCLALVKSLLLLQLLPSLLTTSASTLHNELLDESRFAFEC